MKLHHYLAALALVSSFAYGADGMIQVKSPHSAKVTADKLEHVVRDRGLVLFARIDHAAGAVKIGKSIRPTEVFVFGSPQAGTPFIECAQSVGIDLPLKALVWEDAQGQVWLGYNEAQYIAKRHEAQSCPVVENIGKALTSIASAVVAP